MYKSVTVNINWNSMIAGMPEEYKAFVNKEKTIIKYEQIVEFQLRQFHDKIDENTEIKFTDGCCYTHETDDGLDDGIQANLETIWDEQSYWVYDDCSANLDRSKL